MSICLRRREFIAARGGMAVRGAGAAGPRTTHRRAHGVRRKRCPGEDFIFCVHSSACGPGLDDGRNVRVDVRWYGNDTNRIRALAQELVGLQTDIILAASTPATVAVQRETRTIPIVFVGDPVASGIVVDRPGGNITGFGNFEGTLGGKWLELLSEIAPGLKRAATRGMPLVMLDSRPRSALGAATRIHPIG